MWTAKEFNRSPQINRKVYWYDSVNSLPDPHTTDGPLSWNAFCPLFQYTSTQETNESYSCWQMFYLSTRDKAYGNCFAAMLLPPAMPMLMPVGMMPLTILALMLVITQRRYLRCLSFQNWSVGHRRDANDSQDAQFLTMCVWMNDSDAYITAGIGIVGGIAAAGITGVAAQSCYTLSKTARWHLGQWAATSVIWHSRFLTEVRINLRTFIRSLHCPRYEH